MFYSTFKIETRNNRGRSKLGIEATCAKCGGSLTEAQSYVVHITQTPTMPAPAFTYYHWDHAPAMGSGWGDFHPGDPITSPADVKVGDMLLEFIGQFNAYNVIKVTKTQWAGEPENLRGRKFYGVFVNPAKTSEERIGSNGEFCRWDHEMDGHAGRHGHQLYRAV